MLHLLRWVSTNVNDGSRDAPDGCCSSNLRLGAWEEGGGGGGVSLCVRVSWRVTNFCGMLWRNQQSAVG